MGWTFTHTPLPRGIKTEDHVAAKFNITNSRGERQETIAAAKVGGTVYLALRVTPPEDAAFVTALVVLTKRSAGGFGYKVMDEEMGPSESRCPARILDLLSPVSALRYPKYAEMWRQRCRANLVSNPILSTAA